MNQVITHEEAEQAIQEVVKRAQTDSEFRRLCLTEPNTAAKQAIGKDVPEGFTLRFIENQGADLTVVLPDFIDEKAELSDKDLDQVAGGKCAGSCAASCAVTSCVCVGIPSVTGIAGI